MKMNKYLMRWCGICLLAILLSPGLYAQKNDAQVEKAEDILRQTNVSYLRAFAHADSIRYYMERERAIAAASVAGMPVSGKTRDGGDFSLQGFDGNGQLEYFKTDNIDEAVTIGTDQVWPGGDAGLELTGAGFTMAIWDGGKVRSTHAELSGRITLADGASTLSDHSTHVAGTICAAGVDPDAMGMAYEANLRAFDFNNDASEMASEASQGLRVSNHSYGSISGWDYNSDLSRWEWWGDAAINATTDYKFGFYDSRARDWDNMVVNAPFYLPVKSAGNDRNNVQPSGAYWVKNTSGTWVSSTAFRQPDGGANGYDCIPTYGTAKNILTVGAIKADVYGGLVASSMSTFSSWGPTDDGRIKPDVVSRGVGTYSSTGVSNTSYGTMNGTSMSSPSVSGSILLIQEHVNNLYPGSALRASAMKALVIHTAGGEDGPNYEWGWGIMNTRAAVDLLSNADGRQWFHSRDTLFNNSSREFTLYHDGSDFKITIAWTDPAGTVSAASLNPTTLRLVNDLDLRLISLADNATYYPWRLNPSSPDAPATQGDNFRDNVEQVYQPDLPAGWYKVRVTHKGSITGAFQLFSTMITGVIPPPTCVGNTSITNCSGTITDGSGNNDYTNDLDCSWTIAPPNAAAVTLSFNAFNIEDGFDFLRVYDGPDENSPLLGTFTGTTLPQSLTANSGKMFISFTSDVSFTGGGWSANYSCTAGSPPLAPVISAGGSTSLCSGQTVTLTATNICSGCTVHWSGGQSTPSIVVSSAGAYSATYSNAFGTGPVSNSIAVTTIANPTIPTINASGSTSLCNGQSVTLSAANICSGCSVQWSNGQSGANIMVSNAGTYTASFSNSCGASPASNAVTVTSGTAPTAPSISASGGTSLCNGQSLTLSAANICSGCSVQWSNGQSGANIMVSNAGTYTANFSNSCGTSPASNAIMVTSGTAPTAPSISASGGTSLCNGQSLTLSAANICSGCSVQWSNGQSGANIMVSNAGTYTASLSNTCGTSPASNAVTVTSGTTPDAPFINASGPTSLCNGQSVTLSAANVCSGCTVQWSNGQSGTNIIVSNAGTYTASLSNSCGISTASNTIEITTSVLPVLPVITSDGSTTLCPGESVILTATNICSGCTVQWSNGQNTTGIIVTATGSYTATYANTCGPGATSTPIQIVSGAAPFAPSITAGGPSSLCPGQTLMLTASNICPGCTVMWSTGETGPSIIVNQAGNFSATTENNCGSSPASTPITVSIAGVFTPLVQVNSLCYLAAPSGTNYQWSVNGAPIPGATGQFWTAAVSGYYVVSMTNGAGCEGISVPVFAESCVSATQEPGDRLEVRLYPNPAQGQVFLDVLTATATTISLDLYAADGRYLKQLFQGKTRPGQPPIELSIGDLPAGVYLYRLVGVQGSSCGRLVVQD